MRRMRTLRLDASLVLLSRDRASRLLTRRDATGMPETRSLLFHAWTRKACRWIDWGARRAGWGRKCTPDVGYRGSGRSIIATRSRRSYRVATSRVHSGVLSLPAADQERAAARRAQEVVDPV